MNKVVVVSWLSLCNYCICNKIQQKMAYFTTHALIFSCCSSSPSTSILMDTIPQIFLVGFNYPLFCIPWLKAVLTGTNYDGTLCIIKKYKSTSEECHHWISIHFPSISHLLRKWPLKFLMEVIIIRPVFMLLPLPYWNIFGTIFVFISHKSHKCLADFSQSFIIGMAAKLAHKNVAKNTKRTTSC